MPVCSLVHIAIFAAFSLAPVLASQDPVSSTALMAPTTYPGRLWTIYDSQAKMDVNSFTYAPDGVALAYVLVRSALTPRQDYRMFDEKYWNVEVTPGGDVWVQREPGRKPVNVTQGITDGTSWWGPQWSPDGQRLAMFSTRGGAMRVWVWERATGILRLAVQEPVDVKDGIHWLDAQQLLVHIKSRADTLYGRYPVLPVGDGVTASVLDAGEGVGQPGDAWPHGQLVSINTVTGARQVVAPAIAPAKEWRARGIRRYAVSPGRQWVAVAQIARLTALTRNRDWTIKDQRDELVHHKVELRTLAGAPVRLERALPEGLKQATLAWSSDGDELAFLAAGSAPTAPPQLVRVLPATGTVRTIPIAAFGADSTRYTFMYTLRWLPGGAIALGAPDANAYLSFASWRVVVPLTGAPRVPTAAEISALAKSNDFAPDEYPDTSDATGGAQGGQRVATAPNQSGAVFVRSDERQGLVAWRVLTVTKQRHALIDTLVVANQHLRTIGQMGRLEVVPYVSSTGERLNARLYRPVNAPASVKLPIVVWVYPGQRKGPSNAALEAFAASYAARGYSVLHVSTPWRNRSDGGNGLLAQLPGVVLPAVDSLVSRGVADPDRLFITGGSYGGYATLAVIGQTQRFRGAIASAGVYNWTSNPQTMHSLNRYEGSGVYWLQNGGPFVERPGGKAGDMGGPVWQYPDRYVQNSPLFLADKITTPVLFMHNDRDGAVPIEQSEEMYGALWRQGKRARFIRYWGEGHSVGVRPANDRDAVWQQLAWFDDVGDIQRDARGNIIWEQGRARSRSGKPSLTVKDFERFDWEVFRQYNTTATPGGH